MHADLQPRADIRAALGHGFGCLVELARLLFIDCGTVNIRADFHIPNHQVESRTGQPGCLGILARLGQESFLETPGPDRAPISSIDCFFSRGPSEYAANIKNVRRDQDDRLANERALDVSQISKPFNRYKERLGNVKFPGPIGIIVWSDRKSTRLNSSHIQKSRMPSSA